MESVNDISDYAFQTVSPEILKDSKTPPVVLYLYGYIY